MSELDRLLEQERIKSKKERDEFIWLFNTYFEGEMLITPYFVIEYENDKFYFIVEKYASEDGAGFYSKKEITFWLAKRMYEELR